MTYGTAYLVEKLLLAKNPYEHVYVPVEPDSGLQLWSYLARATTGGGVLAMCEKAAHVVRGTWSAESRRAYPDVPLTITSLDDLPELPADVPLIFVLSKHPLGAHYDTLRRAANSNNPDTLLAVCLPPVVIKLLRREALLVATRLWVPFDHPPLGPEGSPAARPDRWWTTKRPGRRPGVLPQRRVVE